MFPCKYLKPSEEKPNSVHKLKPGDIDVVAAIGNSITAGAAALSKNIFEPYEYRGVSFSIGKDFLRDERRCIFHLFMLFHILREIAR